MQPYTLTDEHIDTEAERSLIAAVTRQPALYWELLDLPLKPAAFTAHRDHWQHLAAAIEQEQAPEPVDWTPAANPADVGRHLLDLHQRRQLAEVLERIAGPLADPARPAAETALLLEEEAARIQVGLRESQGSSLRWASDLVVDVLRDAEARHQTRLTTGKAASGIPTGIGRLDDVLGGLEGGQLYLLAGGPGVGKTTMAWQIAAHATKEAPAIYITFENSPASLTMKALAAKAGVSTRDILRGFADPAKLREAAERWSTIAERIAVVEGTASLTVAQIRANAIRAMARHRAECCVIIVDYLQLMAKASSALRDLGTIRERVEALGADLRGLAVRLNCPVIALASQNRLAGYGGKGSAAIDTLKESGDLEYMADVVAILMESDRVATPPAKSIDLKIGKHRHGENDVTIPLVFRPDIATFCEVAK